MYELIHAERESIPVARACRVLNVSRSGYYEWLRGDPSARAVEDAVLAAEVREWDYPALVDTRKGLLSSETRQGGSENHTLGYSRRTPSGA